MRKAYEHHDELMPHRTLRVETNGAVVKVICDAPGVARVSHVLTMPEWAMLVSAVAAEAIG